MLFWPEACLATFSTSQINTLSYNVFPLKWNQLAKFYHGLDRCSKKAHDVLQIWTTWTSKIICCQTSLETKLHGWAQQNEFKILFWKRKKDKYTELINPLRLLTELRSSEGSCEFDRRSKMVIDFQLKRSKTFEDWKEQRKIMDTFGKSLTFWKCLLRHRKLEWKKATYFKVRIISNS